MIEEHNTGSRLDDISSEERSIYATLTVTSLIFIYYLVRVLALFRAGTPPAPNVYRLWVTVIIMMLVLNILVAIAAQILYAIGYYIHTRDDDPGYGSDERDNLISLKGSRTAYLVLSVGVFGSMLTMALGAAPLVMFSLLIAVSLAAAMSSSVSRLILYRRGV